MEFQAKLGQLHNTARGNATGVLMNVLRTTIEMLNDRGYDNIQSCQSVDEVWQNMADARVIVAGSGARSAHVFFHNEERVGVKQMRSWAESSSADRIIILSLEGPTSFTRREAENTFPNVQFFLFRDMCMNVTRHVLVPKHTVVTGDDTEVLKVKNDLPILYTNDRIAQYYDYRPGDIVRIVRTAGTQEPTYFYRIVRLPVSV